MLETLAEVRAHRLTASVISAQKLYRQNLPVSLRKGVCVLTARSASAIVSKLVSKPASKIIIADEKRFVKSKVFVFCKSPLPGVSFANQTKAKEREAPAMDGKVIGMNNDRIALKTDEGIIVFDIIGGHSTELRDIISGDFSGHGGTRLFNKTQNESLSVCIECIDCDRDIAKNLLDSV